MVSKNVGNIERCVVGAVEREDKPLRSAEGRDAMWHCHEICVTNTTTGDKYVLSSALKTWTHNNFAPFVGSCELKRMWGMVVRSYTHFSLEVSVSPDARSCQFDKRRITREEQSVMDSAVFRFVFPCKAWISIAQKISRKYAKALDCKSVEESQMSAVRSESKAESVHTEVEIDPSWLCFISFFGLKTNNTRTHGA